MYEYLGIFNDMHEKTFYVKIKANDREHADSKFLNYLSEKGYSKGDGEMFVVPLFADFEII